VQIGETQENDTHKENKAIFNVHFTLNSHYCNIPIILIIKGGEIL